MAEVRDDPRLAEAQAMPIGEIADRLEISGLKRAGVEMVGPCPECGGVDRFGVNLRKGVFQCRRCGAKGDGVELVKWLRGLTFPDALTWLCGPAEGISDEERARRRRIAEQNARRREAESDRYRRKAREAAVSLWTRAVAAEATDVRGYLVRRGIAASDLPDLPKALRFMHDCRYMVPDGRGWKAVHTGPAMIAAIQGPDGYLSGVHRTWIDLSQPKGKARLTDPTTGAALDAKKSLGSVKGGAIRLITPHGADTLIMGEGIETTLSARVSGLYPQAAYWAGISLGNMAGVMRKGKGLRYAGLPDMSDREAFVPPQWVRRLVFIQDGDSEPRLTRAKLLSGLRRAMKMRPGLRGQIVHAGEGRDLNDIILGERDDGSEG